MKKAQLARPISSFCVTWLPHTTGRLGPLHRRDTAVSMKVTAHDRNTVVPRADLYHRPQDPDTARARDFDSRPRRLSNMPQANHADRLPGPVGHERSATSRRTDRCARVGTY